MNRRITTKGLLALLIGVAGSVYLLAGPAGAPTPAAQASPTPVAPAAPADEIDVEQAVDFPYDI